MASFQPGDVILISFPFTDGARVKRRPALVILDAGDDDVLVARIKAQPRQTAFDHNLTEWAKAGLKEASIVRLHKLATLKKQLVERKLGSLSAGDWKDVCRSFAQVLDAMQPKKAGKSQGTST